MNAFLDHKVLVPSVRHTMAAETGLDWPLGPLQVFTFLLFIFTLIKLWIGSMIVSDDCIMTGSSRWSENVAAHFPHALVD